MNLSQLQQFMFVLEEGSVTKGAEKGMVSQPALSRALADLETALGVRLFDRSSKGVIPTEAGRTLATYAKQIFILEQEATDAISDIKGLQGGRLSIGASTTIGDFLLPSVVGEFSSKHPGVEISMEIANSNSIQHGVTEGRYDLGLTEGDADYDRFRVEILMEDILAVIVAPTHPLATRQPSLSEIESNGFVMRERGSGTRMIVERGFREAGIRPRVLCALGSTTAIKGAVKAGIGLGIVSVLAVETELSRGELAVIPTPLHLSRQFHLIRLPWRGDSVALASFLSLLKRRSSLKSNRLA